MLLETLLQLVGIRTEQVTFIRFSDYNVVCQWLSRWTCKQLVYMPCLGRRALHQKELLLHRITTSPVTSCVLSFAAQVKY